jgi:hypothetical protein
MILVALGRGQPHDPGHEVERRRRPHAAQHTDHCCASWRLTLSALVRRAR